MFLCGFFTALALLAILGFKDRSNESASPGVILLLVAMAVLTGIIR